MGFCGEYNLKKKINHRREECEDAHEYEIEINNVNEKDIGLSFDKTTYNISRFDYKIVLKVLKSQNPELWNKEHPNDSFEFDDKGLGCRLKIIHEDGTSTTYKLVPEENDKLDSEENALNLGNDDSPF